MARGRDQDHVGPVPPHGPSPPDARSLPDAPSLPNGPSSPDAASLPHGPPPSGQAELFRAAFDAAAVAMMVMAPDLGPPGPTITHANAALSALTGYRPDELVGRSSRLLQGPRSDRAELGRRRRRLLRDGRYAGEAVACRKDGTDRLLHWSISAIPGPAGTVQGWLAVLRDAGPPERRDRGSDPDNHRKLLFEAIPHLVWQSYDGGNWRAASPQWVAFTGQVEAASCRDGWRAMIAPEDLAATDAAWRAAGERGVMAVEHRIRRRDGAYRWFQTRALPVAGRKDAARRLWVGTSTDIDELRTAEARIRHLAYHDVLTDIGNRGMLRDTLERMTTGAAAEVPFNVFCLDVDDFKSINDQFGHRGGDEALQEVSRRMVDWSRASDTVARVGGDEFVLVQANAMPADSPFFAERLRYRLSQPFMVADRELRISASIGIASYPRDGRDADTLLQRADLALYSAKLENGPRLRQFEPAMEQARHQRHQMRTGLARAIEHDELWAAYQAVSCARTGAVRGYEALARWTHPELGAIPPASFIPLAEESGMIVPLGRWMLERACRDAAQPGFNGRRVAVNLSPLQFRSRTLAQTVCEAMDRHGLAPDRLELEVTERLLIDGDSGVEQALRACKALGVGIALDDFGTGYANLDYLCRFPFDRLKIDQSLVRRMVEDDGARIVVGAIIALAHNLRLRVTAEGVETERQLAMLREMECDEVQGFLLGRPSPASALGQDAPAGADRQG